MPLKPWPIVVLPVLFFLAPLAIVLQAGITVNLPLFGSINIWSRLSIIDWIVLGTYEVCALSIMSIRRLGWFSLIIGEICLIAFNIMAIIIRPSYSLIEVLFFNVLLIAVGSFFFQPGIITLYFSPKLRWWKSLPRFKTDVSLVLHDREEGDFDLVTHDISETGCYVISDLRLRHGAVYDATILCFRHKLDVYVQVVRTGSAHEVPGYGFVFLNVDRRLRIILRAMMLQLNLAIHSPYERHGKDLTNRSRRVQLMDRMELETADGPRTIRIVDISLEGCSFKCPLTLERMETAVLRWNGAGMRFDVDCVLVWDQVVHNERSYGVRFQSPDRKTVKKIRTLLRRLHFAGAQMRKIVPMPDAEVNELAMHTPYRYVSQLRGKMYSSRKSA